jgi:hypothetical protein
MSVAVPKIRAKRPSRAIALIPRGNCCSHGSFLGFVTSEVAGSSPVVPAIPFNHLAFWICPFQDVFDWAGQFRTVDTADASLLAKLIRKGIGTAL